MFWPAKTQTPFVVTPIKQLFVCVCGNLNNNDVIWFHRSLQESIVFREMRKYLSSLLHRNVSISDQSDDQLVDTQDGEGGGPPAKVIRLTKKTQVELTNLFTDVAALTRRESRLKVYTNHCYTVNRNSKPIVIDI